MNAYYAAREAAVKIDKSTRINITRVSTIAEDAGGTAAYAAFMAALKK